MDTVLLIFILIAMLGTLVVLGLGVIQMVRGGDPRRSNKLMRSRVMLQAIAIGLFGILLMLLKH